jgi:ClpP class serine protease
MARDQEPVTEEEIQALQEEMDDQREEIREALAEDLGGEPEDYDAEKYLSDRAGETVADGGE